MAKKKVAAIVKIQIPAGKATPAPPVGTALGPHGVPIMDFVKQYNAATEAQVGTIIPVEITVFEDRSFTFVLKTPPTPVLPAMTAAIGPDSPDCRRSTSLMAVMCVQAAAGDANARSTSAGANTSRSSRAR